MYRDQFGEFVCGYWELKGLPVSIEVSTNFDSSITKRKTERAWPLLLNDYSVILY